MSKTNGKGSLAGRLRKLADKSTPADIPALGEPVYFRSPSTKVAMSLATFNPKDPESFEAMAQVVSDHTFDDDGKRVFGREGEDRIDLVDLPASVGLLLIENFSKLIKADTVPLVQSAPPSTV